MKDSTMVTYRGQYKFKEHLTAAAMESEWKKRGNKRRMRACHGNTIFFFCNLRVKIMVRYPYDVKFPEYYLGILFQASHWNFCSLIGQSCSLLCSLHGRAQQNFNMAMRKKTMKTSPHIFSGQGDFPLDDLKQQSPIFLAPRTGFMEDSSSTDWRLGGREGLWDDSSTLRLLCTLFLILCCHWSDRGTGPRPGRCGPLS